MMTAKISKWGPGLVFLSICLILSCGEHFAPQTHTAIFRNDTLQFPLRTYSSIRAYSLRNSAQTNQIPLINATGQMADYVLQPGKALSPAHRADLFVSLAMPPDSLPHWYCPNFQYAIVYFNQNEAIAALSFSSSCNSYRFQPESPHQLGPNNLARLKAIFD